MRATEIEFHLRLAIIFAIVAVGFWSPWIEAWGIGARIPLLEWSALELSRMGLFNFTMATPVVIVIAAAIAGLGAIFRVWGTAWLGARAVNNREMNADSVMTAGPYRYVRNPLYLGTEMTMAATSFVMPPTGAVFTIVLIAIFQLRLILGEEAFLSARLGEPYQRYLRAVPRLFPRLRSGLPDTQGNPQWGRAVLAEIYPIGVFLILAALSWRYENLLMIKAFLICFGISLVVRALMPTRDTATASTP